MLLLAVYCVGALAIPPQHMSHLDSSKYNVIKFEEGLELIDEAFYAGE